MMPCKPCICIMVIKAHKKRIEEKQAAIVFCLWYRWKSMFIYQRTTRAEKQRSRSFVSVRNYAKKKHMNCGKGMSLKDDWPFFVQCARTMIVLALTFIVVTRCFFSPLRPFSVEDHEWMMMVDHLFLRWNNFYDIKQWMQHFRILKKRVCNQGEIE